MTFGEYKALKVTLENHVVTVTLNRPEKLNAWNDEIETGLSEILTECDNNDQIRVVIVTGAGRAFCAGADLAKGGNTFSGREEEEYELGSPGKIVYPFMIKKPVIAAINGHAIGVGITYPMTCDIRIVADEAKIAFPFVRLGVIPELAAHITVARTGGFSTAAYLLLSGKTISGKEFAEFGLALQHFQAQEVLPIARKIAEDIAINTAPVSVAISKRLLWEGLTTNATDMIRKEDLFFGWAGNQSDAVEGVKSFQEKRAPNWHLSPSKDFPSDLFTK